MSKCTYPDCDCALSFPTGHKPSEATECPRDRHDAAVKRLKDKRRKRVANFFTRTELEQLSTLERPHIATRKELITNVVTTWDQDNIREEFDKILAGLRE